MSTTRHWLYEDWYTLAVMPHGPLRDAFRDQVKYATAREIERICDAYGLCSADYACNLDGLEDVIDAAHGAGWCYDCAVCGAPVGGYDSVDYETKFKPLCFDCAGAPAPDHYLVRTWEEIAPRPRNWMRSTA